PAAPAPHRAWRLDDAGRPPADDGQALAGGGARRLRGQEGARRAELLRVTEARGGNSLSALRAHRLGGDPTIRGLSRMQRAQPIGGEVAGHHEVDRDVRVRDIPCDTGEETGESCPRATRSEEHTSE